MFIQCVKAKARDEAVVRGAIERWRKDLMPGAVGYLGTTSGMLDDGTYLVLARFESAEAAQRNSDRPEQGEWFAELSKGLEGEPEFLNVDNVELWLGGGSDDAGFVQVMIGHSPDVEALRARSNQDVEALQAARPELIGGTQGTFGDNGFLQAVYFRSEDAARQSEAGEPPAEMREMMDEFQRLLGDVTYYDLHHPEFVSAT